MQLFSRFYPPKDTRIRQLVVLKHYSSYFKYVIFPVLPTVQFVIQASCIKSSCVFHVGKKTKVVLPFKCRSEKGYHTYWTDFFGPFLAGVELKGVKHFKTTYIMRLIVRKSKTPFCNQ